MFGNCLYLITLFLVACVVVAYEEPEWWPTISSTFTGINLKRCVKRDGNSKPIGPPPNGARCARRPKTCFFGNQVCNGFSYPTTQCLCEDRTWQCIAEPCPSFTGPPTNPPEDSPMPTSNPTPSSETPTAMASSPPSEEFPSSPSFSFTPPWLPSSQVPSDLPSASPTQMLRIIDVDPRENENEKAHKTDKYVDFFVLRRARTFTTDVKLNSVYDPDIHQVFFEARHSFDGAETVIDIPEYEGVIPEFSWGTVREKVVVNDDGTKTAEMKINLPPDLALGEYSFKALVRNRIGAEVKDQEAFPSKIVIVFNPGSANDDVFIKNEAQRNEYVMAERGRIWFTKMFDNMRWDYLQFNKESMQTLLKVLDGQKAAVRKDASAVSRHLSKLANSQDDNGIIAGKWEKPYTGGTKPWIWRGSDQIFRAFIASGAPVKFGQCWVYGGVLTSLLRSAGIPSRPLTNFDSGHDGNADKDIDVYFDENGKFEKRVTVDSVWNFHVWNDAWILGQWNAVDGTPQERSGGFFQLGPAPHSAIKNDFGGQYDVDFVFAEVDADYNQWLRPGAGQAHVKHASFPKHIGHFISTKAVGANVRHDITALYKTPERRRPLQQVGAFPQVVEIAFNPPEQVDAGEPIILDVQLSNSTEDLSVRVAISASAMIYNGTLASSVGEFEIFRNISIGETVTIPYEIPSSDYFNGETGIITTIETHMAVTAPGHGILAFVSERTVVGIPRIFIDVTPSGSPLAVGTDGSFSFNFTNPLSESIENLVATISVSEGGLELQNGSEMMEIDLGTLSSSDTVTVVSQDFSVLSEGIHRLSVILTSDTIASIFADEDIACFNPETCVLLENSVDCNGNGVPDECDLATLGFLDCNGNGIPDICDDDCNGNGVPDDCDLANGFSMDANDDGIPDECTTPPTSV